MEHAFAYAGAIGWYCTQHQVCQHDPVTWRDVDVKRAVDLQLPLGGVEGPTNELGEQCPWPWDPQQLVGVPMGQYHCPYCGGMQIAGVEHLDHRDIDMRMEQEMVKEPHEDLVAKTIAEGAQSPQEVVDEATRKLPGFKRTEVTKDIIADEAHRQLVEETDPE